MDVLGVGKSQSMPYIKEKAEHYWMKFEKMERLNKKRSWNWCAFLVAPFWMAYRKMYDKAAIVVAMIIIFHSLDNFVGSDSCPLPDMLALVVSVILTVCILAIYVLSGLYGNYVYKCKIDALVAEGELLEGEAKKQHEEKHGGVSVGATVLYMVIYLVINIAIVTLFI